MTSPLSGNPSNVEIVLTFGNREAIVSPYGASLRGYFERLPDVKVRDIVTRYAGAVAPKPQERARAFQVSSYQVGQKTGGQGDVLIPFPGRIKDGVYQFNGRRYQLDRNDHEGPNAIHGFLRSTVWEYDEPQDDAIRFFTNLYARDYSTRGYPFTLKCELRYSLGDDGLTCRFAITNGGDNTAPVGAGFHPYFTTGSPLIDADTLHLPFQSMLEFNEALLPTGKVLPVAGTAYDFTTPRTIQDLPINNCFLAPARDEDGKARVRLTGSGRTVVVWMDAAFDYVVLYSGDPLPTEHRRRSLAIEPMTCGSDAFNRPAWGLTSLEPGQTMTGSWGATVEQNTAE